MNKKIFITVVFFVFLALDISMSASVYRLKDTVISSTNIISLASLFENAPEWKNYSITLQNSKYFDNSEISTLVRDMTGTAPTILGKGVNLVYISQWQSPKDLIRQISDVFSQYEINWSTFTFPLEIFYIQDLQGQVSSNRLNLSLKVISPDETKYKEAQYLLKLDVTPSTEKPLSNSNMYIQNVQGHAALIVFRKGGLLMHMKAPILRDLGNGRYLVMNPQSGKTFEVKLDLNGVQK